MPIWNPFNSSQPSPPPVPASEANNSSSSKSSAAAIILPDGKQFGLKNFGNTCYANSVLQALYFCAPFRDLIIQTEDPSQQPQPQPHSQSDWLVPPATAPVVPSSITTPPASPGGRRRPERRPSANITSVADPRPSTTSSSPPTGPPIPARAPTLFSALRSLYIHIAQNSLEKGTVAPSAFIDILKELNEEFRSTNHQDAHEFLNFLLNSVVEDIQKARSALPAQGGYHHGTGHDTSNSIATLGGARSTSLNSAGISRDPTLVHKLFEGVLTSETRCLTCESVSSRDEAFLDLSIDIEKNSSITACLRQFSQSEMLCQKNKFFCDSCCDLQEAEKRMKIKKLPNVLALHLKRFKYQEEEGRFIKLAYRVPFPKELRLFNTVDDVEDPDRLYSLWAIVVHIGAGPNHGHYIAIIKTIGGWLCFDDESIYPVKEEDIPKYYGDSTSGSAYVLYYQAVDMDLHALGLPSRTPESEAVTVPTSIVTTSITPRSVSAPAAPVIPPGLETDHSEISDSPAPTTPSSSLRAPSTPFSPEKEKMPLRIVPPQAGAFTTKDTKNSPSTPTLGRRVGEGGSRTLAESVKKLGNDLAHRRSRVSLTPSSSSRPSTAPGKSEVGSAAGAVGEHEPVPPIPALDMRHHHRPPERQPPTWGFKRRSKAEKSNREDWDEAHRHLPPPLPISPGGDEPNSGKDLPVTPWDEPDHHSPNRTHQYSYEPPLSSSATTLGSMSSPKTLPHDMSSSIIGTSSSRPSSSSHRSVHSAVGHRSSIEFPKTMLQPIPATPPSANRRHPSPSAVADEQGRRHVTLPGTPENGDDGAEVDHSRRGDASDSLHMYAPANPHVFDVLHPISRSPPVSASSKLHPMALHRSASQAASARAPSASGMTSSEFDNDGSSAGGIPSSYHHSNGSDGVGNGNGNRNGAQNGSSSGDVPTMFKRASRKLSISASLGFGRKK